ncbi:cobyric acid synthase [Clostridium cellulovorans]|uniref:Cobyric acid synthase n=1 Tax=Clostridium cellulovorans (strain ATCC 35296 / DSM 3052 / OCM 3 / 743B) TaxID=573061 RepID=D9SNZ0_CLOC7|nr:cobyric acid synthase [Clostridium cellulovorans]ADL51955.1 cobyric acid synthase CobQ [Clostridium cellulovorans 743B]
MSAKAIMIQGTMSNSGKTFITAGLCRVFMQDGYKVAPFKSQNMALNSYITSDGLEIGRAQAMQAEAAGIEPKVTMNPILLKPTSTMGSQVIVNGEVMGNMKASDYFRNKTNLIPEVKKAYDSLTEEYDIIVIEGAGSPAEINLKENDIVNMGMAKMANAPVLLVADIDRGGVFASVYGTIMLLEEEEKKMMKGVVINKFRGDVEILKPGLDMLEEKVHVPVVGVVPYESIYIDDEDSLSERLTKYSIKEGIDIAIIKLPHISNFTDFNVLELFKEVSLRYVRNKSELGKPDLIILPGTKNTMADLSYLRESGLEGTILRLVNEGTKIIGICGGFQILGKELHDPLNIEHGGSMRGMGLLDISTTFEKSKVRTRTRGYWAKTEDIYEVYNKEISGYEIHMGGTKNLGTAKAIITLEDGRIDGYGNENLSVWGSYLHGIFDNEELTKSIIKTLMNEKGITSEENNLSLKDYKEEQYNKLADLIRNSIDMKKVYEILEEGV